MLYAIAAVDREWGIGRNGKLLFSIPDDLKQFKQKTMGTYVIMGRKTFESLPGAKPLPGRDNIVITKSESFETQHPDVIVCHDPHDPLRVYAGSKGWSAAYSEGSVFLTTTDGGYTWHAPETNPKGMKLGSVADILSPESMKEVEVRPGGGAYIGHDNDIVGTNSAR